MRNAHKPIITIMTATCAACFTLAACTTEPDVSNAADVEESTVVAADAAAVGVPNPNGDATPVTAVEGENALGDGDAEEPEAPSGAQPTNDITSG